MSAARAASRVSGPPTGTSSRASSAPMPTANAASGSGAAGPIPAAARYSAPASTTTGSPASTQGSRGPARPDVMDATVAAGGAAGDRLRPGLADGHVPTGRG